jgi:uncharacterized protein YhaN
MRILRLDLSAFGPFTDKKIDLSLDGMHVIYGPNEAGKSSALRALKCLLYGIPARSQDNFIHDNRVLRIGGLIADERASQLYFIRRKGTKDTLLDASGAPLSEKVLERYLHGVTREVFEFLFGIDHEALVAGGRSLLAGKGEAGESLFTAGTGAANLGVLISQIDARADGLFRAKARNPIINAAIARYHEAKTRISDLSVSSSEWVEKEEKLKKALAEREGCQYLIESRQAELNHLKRIKALIPKVAIRRDIAGRLSVLGSVVILPEDFSRKRQKAQGDLVKAEEKRSRADIDLKRLMAERAGIELPERILQRADDIKEIHQRLGQHKKAASDLGKLEGAYAGNMADVERLIAEVKPGASVKEILDMRPRAAAKALIQRLARDHEVLRSGLERSEGDMAEAEEKMRKLKEEIASLGPSKDPSRLKKALLAAGKGDIPGRLKDVRRALKAEERAVSVLIARLRPCPGSLDDLISLPVPSMETINRFNTRFEETAILLKGRRELLSKTEQELKAVQLRIKAVEMAGAVPTEQELVYRRQRRDLGWGLVKRAWLAGEDVEEEAMRFDPQRGLAEAYEEAVVSSDEIADRLRREASRVAEFASLLSRQEMLEAEVERLHSDIKALGTEAISTASSWREQWAPCRIEPSTPAEMRDWLALYEKILRHWENLAALKADLESLTEQMQRHKRELSECLKDLEEEVDEEEGLEKILQLCEAALDSIEKSSRRRSQLESRLSSLSETASAAERSRDDTLRRLSAWQAQWVEALRDFGLPESTRPEEAVLVISKNDELFKKLEECQSLARRIEGIKRDAKIFATDVKNLVSHCVPHMKDLGPELAALSLNAELSKGLQAEAGYRAIEKEISQKKTDMLDAEKDIAIANERLLDLCRLAGCSSPAELEDRERLSSEFIRLKSELTALDTAITELGAGVPIEEVLTEVDTYDMDSVEASIERLEAEIEELKTQYKDLGERVGALRNELARVDGSDSALAAAQEAQEVLSEIRSGAEDYVVLRLSSLVLRKAMETYRAGNQGPLIERAGELFARLTLGSFSGIRIDYGEGDEPVLYGLRPTGALVGVAGMSDGSLDQLYLALRLATLERYLEKNEAMPFVVDDILIRFDDERSKAALEVLAELSGKTQVLFFTHHARMLDLAKKVKGRGEIFFSLFPHG